jgi:hypothetical protein
MSETKQNPEIYAAMIAIAKEVPSIGKGQKNAAQNYVFRGVDDVFNALQPVISRNGVFLSQEIIELKRDERPHKNGGVMSFVTTRVRYSFIAKDGSTVTTESAGEGADMGDKATAKSLSIAMKYCLLQTFLVPTADAGHDPENDNPELPAAPSSPAAKDDFFDEPAEPDPWAYLDDLKKAKYQLKKLTGADEEYYNVLTMFKAEHADKVNVTERPAALKLLREAYRRAGAKAAKK